MRVITLDKNSHLKFHSISLAFLVRKKHQKQISLEITRQRNKHGMARNLMHTKMLSPNVSEQNLIKMQLCAVLNYSQHPKVKSQWK